MSSEPKTVCKSGHDLTLSGAVWVIPQYGGKKGTRRMCVECHRINGTRTRERQRERRIAEGWTPPVRNDSPTCAIEGCERPRKATAGVWRKSLCSAHEKRKETHGDVLADRPVMETVRSVLRRTDASP